MAAKKNVETEEVKVAEETMQEEPEVVITEETVTEESVGETEATKEKSKKKGKIGKAWDGYVADLKAAPVKTIGKTVLRVGEAALAVVGLVTVVKTVSDNSEIVETVVEALPDKTSEVVEQTIAE